MPIFYNQNIPIVKMIGKQEKDELKKKCYENPEKFKLDCLDEHHVKLFTLTNPRLGLTSQLSFDGSYRDNCFIAYVQLRYEDYIFPFKYYGRLFNGPDIISISYILEGLCDI